MPDISIYELPNAEALSRTLPPLLEKLLQAGHRAVFYCENGAELERLNSWLWSFSTRRFIPHGVKADGYLEDQPIYLTAMPENPNKADILVLYEAQLPPFYTGFSRVLDLFMASDAERLSAAQQRLKVYQAAGYPIKYWKQDANQAWKPAPL